MRGIVKKFLPPASSAQGVIRTSSLAPATASFTAATFLSEAASSSSRDPAEHSHDHGSRSHGSRSVDEWRRILEDPSRDGWQKPAQVVEALGLRPGQDVAGIGAGTGYFSVRFAEAVGPGGKVFAVDIDQGLIDHLNERAKDAGLSNLQAVLAAPWLCALDDPLLSEKSLDIVFICDVIRHVQDRQGYFAKLSGTLRPGGRLAIVDFYKRETPVGPPAAMKIAREDLISELRKAGFVLAREFDFLPHQYFLVFEAIRGK